MKKRWRTGMRLVAIGCAAAMLAGCGASTGGDTASTGAGDYQVVLPTDVEEADIYVEKVDGLSEDFLMGADISTLLVEEASGVKYYNKDGEEEDLCKILADAGVNTIRVRVWNDPFDEDGNGYGGGNCNAATAAEIGKRAAQYGLKLCVDFHYSDFWADPNKQMVPKAWQSYSLEEKQAAVTDFTTEALTTIRDAGADVYMVQIGNEINNGIAGITDFAQEVEFLKSASAAVRGFDPEIKIAVHFTGIDSPDAIYRKATQMASQGLDYDIFGVSYYPYWHGTLDNLTQVLTELTDKYGVATCIMENSYPYTAEDGDDNGNSVDGSNMATDWPVSVQGQANEMRDVIAAASAGGAIGYFYWEPAWVPVGNSKSTNTAIWEQYGSGWASSYAGAYDPEDAGQYYGGCAWDNQALFDFTGKALASLDVFKYVRYGATGKGLEVIKVESPEIEAGIGDEVILPDTLEAMYNDTSVTDPIAVTWNDADKIDINKVGVYEVHGTCADGTEAMATVKVANVNYVINSDFETGDMTGWTSANADGSAAPTDIQEKAADATSGSMAFHFYSTSDMDFYVEQTMEGIEPAAYRAVANIQGGDVGDAAEIVLYVKVGETEYTSDPVTLNGWQQWQTPEIDGIEITETSDVTIGMRIKSAAKGWGTIDDVEFSAVQ